MKYFLKAKFCPDLQIEHFPTRVSIHQSTYIKKTLKLFNIDKTHPLSSPMVVQPLDVKRNSFRPCKKDGNLFGLEVPDFSAINALMNLANRIV